MNICLIDDFFIEDGLLGGGELNNNELVLLLKQNGNEVSKINSHKVTVEYLKNNKDLNFIISNFIRLGNDCIDYLTSNLNYVIYEHDHKYLAERNPAFYEDFKAPKDKIINFNFYNNAKNIFCQSEFHSSIVRKNLELDNIISLGGNLWSLEILQIIEEISKKEKNDICSIMDSKILHKNTHGAISYCANKGLKYDLISSDDYITFLNRIGKNKKLVFFPQTPETLSRIVVESRMMGMSIITNDMVGATKEKWFPSKGAELINIIKQKRSTIPEIIEMSFR